VRVREKRGCEMKKEKKLVTVIGVGLIGGSLCYAMKREGIRVKGVGKSETIKKAIDLGVIDQGYEYSDIEEAIKGSEFVFICTPLSDIENSVLNVISVADKGTIVSDVGSTKSIICKKARENSKKGVYFIGGHPMAGSEKRGVNNASPFLFYDAVYVLTPLPGTPQKAIKKLSGLISLFGAKVMILPPDLHDRIAADISHMPQLVAVLLTNHLSQKNSDLYRNLAAGGFRDMTRVASSSYEIWKDIISSNRSEIERALRELRESIDSLIKNLNDDFYLKCAFNKAQKERKTIPSYSKGFIFPLFDIRINVKDRPGELARITNTVYNEKINIKDIEIVNIREGEGGILRLGFNDRSDAERSAHALRKIGYEVLVVE